MIRENFTPKAPGRLVDITDERGNKGVAFLPDRMPPKFDIGSKAIRIALSHADRALALLDGVAQHLPDPQSLFRSALNREALMSSKIEGTRTTLGDLALFDLTQRPDNDAVAVANYVEAYKYSRKRCNDIPFGVGLLCEIHNVLMRNIEPEKTTPGRLRDRTVLIGAPPPLQARFVPPPAEFVRELTEDLATYLENNDEPPLIRLAAAHYQFETIHPFRDGNGRVGRIMISAWLECQKILTAPMLYISVFFQQRQEEYYDRLLRVSTHGAWEDWVLFFLEAVTTQSKDSAARAKLLAGLRTHYHALVESTKVRSHKSHILVDALFDVPAMSVPRAKKLTGITYPAAKSHVQRLIDLGILSKEPFIHRGVAFYFANELIDAAERPLDEQTIKPAF
jgi:Fic family protein